MDLGGWNLNFQQKVQTDILVFWGFFCFVLFYIMDIKFCNENLVFMGNPCHVQF